MVPNLLTESAGVVWLGLETGQSRLGLETGQSRLGLETGQSRLGLEIGQSRLGLETGQRSGLSDRPARVTHHSLCIPDPNHHCTLSYGLRVTGYV